MFRSDFTVFFPEVNERAVTEREDSERSFPAQHFGHAAGLRRRDEHP
jgi:hypothetical protein